MKKLLFIIISLTIINIVKSQTDTLKQSKISINICYLGNVQTVDKSIYKSGRYPIVAEEEGWGYYDIKYKTAYSGALNINALIKLTDKVKLITGINTFSEKISYTRKDVSFDNFIFPYDAVWTNIYLTIPVEFSYVFKLKSFNIYPYLGTNINALFKVKDKNKVLLETANKEETTTTRTEPLLNSRIFIGFTIGAIISKKIYKNLDLFAKLNFQPSTKILLVENVDYRSGVYSYGIGLGVKYNLGKN